MALYAIPAFLAAGGTDIILLFSALGGLSGLAALVSVWVNYLNNKRVAVTDDKSVAIVELEKAVPGLGTIIKEWQAVVAQLQEDLRHAREEAVEKESELQAKLDLALLALADCQERLKKGRVEL